MRRLWSQNIRQVLPAGSGQAVACLVSAVLALPAGPRRRGHVLQQGRKHLLQEGLLSVSAVAADSIIALCPCRNKNHLGLDDWVDIQRRSHSLVEAESDA